MQPSRIIILIASCWAVLGFCAGIWKDLEPVWFWSGALFGTLMFADLLAGWLLRKPTAQRELPGRFASGVEQMVPVVIRNASPLTMRVEFYDGLPADADSEELPWFGKVRSSGNVKLEYPVTISERGMHEFLAAHVKVRSPLGFWTKSCRCAEAQSTRVYPNYEPVLRYALLAMANRAEQMGIVKKNRAGLSREFHQMRDYQLGDMLNQIDWKSTSKRQSLISRDYQEERDQTVILVVDCGRRMRAMDGGVPQFDHCLNAMLLLAYTALRQGDHVGVMGVGGSERWLSPVKGVAGMTTILNHLYDYETSTAPSDFGEAARQLMTRQRRRALVVMLSNIRGEDGHQMVDPLRMIRRRHVTILANLREESVMKRLQTESESLDDALEVGATAMYLNDRERVLSELRQYGIYTVDSEALQLPVALANAYLGAREMV